MNETPKDIINRLQGKSVSIVSDIIGTCRTLDRDIGDKTHFSTAEYTTRAMLIPMPKDALRLILDLAKRVEVLGSALKEHNNWHLTQTDPDPEHGYIPAEEYCDSSLYERSVSAMKATDLTKWMEEV